MSDFVKELENLINRHSKENASNTPDFLLAEYLFSCLINYNNAVTQRDKWLGKMPQVGVSEDAQTAIIEEFEKKRPKYVISDLDGTIALCDHRRPIIDDKTKPTDERWRAFFAACVDDLPNIPVIENLRALRDAGYEIIIFSARSNEVRDETYEWLAKFGVPYDRIYMRQAGDYTLDCELKASFLEGFDESEILCVFDDRDSVVKMWRERGLKCFQVAPGNF